MTEWGWSIRDGFQVLDNDPITWKDDEDMHKTLSNHGYSHYGPQAEDVIVDSTVGGIKIWEYIREDNHAPSYQYCCFVSMPHERFITVWLKDDPTLLEFLRAYGPPAWQLETAEMLIDIYTMLGKLFRAYHGHDSQDDCLECNPIVYQARQQRRAEAKQRKAAREQEAKQT